MRPVGYRYGMRGALGKVLGVILLVAGLAGPLSAGDRAEIVIVGDSLVQGYGLPFGEGFVPQMQRWLDDHGADVALVNAGVSGDTTTGGLARLDWTLTETTDGIVISLGANDILRGIDPALARSNLTDMVRAATDKGLPTLLIGIDVPPNYGPDYQAAFSAIYPDLARQFDTLLYPDFLSAILERPDRQQALRDLMQGDGLHPNAAGVALIVDDMGPSFLKLLEQIRAASPPA